MSLALTELNTAEEWLDFFQVPYKKNRLAIGRLAMLYRFRRLMDKEGIALPKGEADPAIYTEEVLARMKELLAQAYRDSVEGSVPEAFGWTDSFESNCSKCASKCAAFEEQEG